ncbi:hypothetical protein SAMN04487926_12138 [Paraburkholderia steynii]|uniref:Uncharacterized protein n=1 Tax=Paraburkholderia steynii TaxID=1245441 RepID=A0A7Z7BBY8_9BURK|nr:hypothetical protein [Paraburkholderia steynii]SDI64940.1 hypothetical protein SAMN04487926_12138 [Paraburkholderia steynii]
MDIAQSSFWIVWSPQGVTPPQYRHETLGVAIAEAERLAKLRPGDEFIVLEAVAARCVDGMQRITFSPEVPF